MSIDSDDTERLARLERLTKAFREAERRQLLKRGIELWNRTEGALKERRVPALPPADKSN